MKYYLAIDLGASSGRHIIGYKNDQEIVLEEIYRFNTGMDKSKDGLVWDIPHLYQEILKGIKLSFQKYPNIESLAIDTWGVDYVLMNKDKEIPPFYAYRNKRNVITSEEIHKVIPFEELYKLTGIQYAPFNTIYQLLDDLKKGRLDKATDYLMLPSYFTYKLTGIKTHEYTNESTGALLNPYTGKYYYQLLDRLNLPRKLFKNAVIPPYFVGKLLPEIENEVGGNTNVVLIASHDTASAFAAIKEEGIILSSGTWSLIGIKSITPIISEKSLKANYTNEGGINYIRFLKNIMGMWVVNKTREKTSYTLETIDQHLEKTKYEETFDVNDPSLVSPNDMRKAVLHLLKDKPPKDDFELFASIYHSLAKAYQKAVIELEDITEKKYNNIYVIGGGAKNNYLNKLIERYTKKKVIALPIEATALGNIKLQMEIGEKL